MTKTLEHKSTTVTRDRPDRVAPFYLTGSEGF